MASVTFFVGAVLGMALFSRLPIWVLRAWKTRSIPRLLLAHLVAYLAAASGSAYTFANDGPPLWEFGFRTYLLPALLVAAIDIIGIYRASRKVVKPRARKATMIQSGSFA